MISWEEVEKSDHDSIIWMEYVLQKYGKVLSYGGNPTLYRLAIMHCERISKFTGMSVSSIIKEIKEEYIKITGGVK